MQGKWIYVAFSAFLGLMAALYNFHYSLVIIAILYLIWIAFNENRVSLFFVCSFWLVLCAILFLWTNERNVSHLTGEETSFKGVIKTIPTIDGDRVTFIYQLPSKEKLQVSYRIKTADEKNELSRLQVGMSCRLKGQLTIPQKARNFSAFDYQKFLFYKRIHWLFIPDTVSLSHCTPSTGYKYFLQKWRATQLSFIKDHFPEHTVGFVQALIFGEQEEMSKEVQKDFLQFGLSHLLAISGSHVVLIVAVCFYMFVRLGVRRERAFMIIFCSLPIYMILTGCSPSVVRACLAAMLVLVSQIQKFKIPPLDVASLVFLVMVLLNPYYILDIGFQLSFIVSFTLILSSQIISSYEKDWQKLVVVTVVAQFSSLPLVLYYNFEFSLLSFPLNFLFVPFLSIIILPLSLFSFIASHLFEPFGDFLISFLSILINYAVSFLEEIRYFSQFTLLTFGKPERFFVVIEYIVIIYFFKSWEMFGLRPQQMKKAVLLLLVTFSVHLFSPYFSKEGKITMIDVGQGDSILIELPFRQAVYLVDTGGQVSLSKEKWQERKKTFDVGEDILVPLLKAKGIHKIDKLILTHSDWDHIGGTKAILHHFNVKEVMLGRNEIFSMDNALLNILGDDERANRPIIQFVKKGDYWNEAGLTFYVLGPDGTEFNGNDRSIVLFTKLGGLRWLFTGDLEKEGEWKLLQAYPYLKTDVLKVGHHGSKTSTTEPFIQQIEPKIALISVGENNRFGHPHPEVIDLLKKNKVKVLRTDENGSISYKFIGNKGTFEWLLP
ncbi:DNA internalization-related competence protein ComEC/Rec2 [Calidifontibacillus erzurumensis]|uniref:DNA internalization-related competence protein ComEC/Rec2 n=1 Tax=Calidifontibacillus erzurumensis TaxID=2741433 RepID=A0A8J8GB13_9BACI|nr:DNA internalization-related competence protein ComEC/Rec2 [Calidifontibacillus erzurumensis]NSL50264.1 DNA internalization-related competence protein ComEC/Rec2 [Calidifontibacillus erzurumensis]